ncbi:non-canonical purine NTP pyrophosphatase [Anaerobacillus alkalidiazotrophicus]|uniref:dITP/XTP pyrophosphatase n=1 Tax=Anaerobacillus alkalidiazotrophicus TaxID=472963 RepID=A0A1S2M0U7_9BACI|nr:XTP/dITP diphosphatase [Anaerobacillus alkalidiazotrophicus]OIJ18331.1 non-canonical purine NTP pyrophosphatase [Anaerobacillus alkalidiazotrophicus]OIJ19810.1 non-canonical purine NTP pyrophosphatase [Anaerobacillus alkalidiazotrophicus]
MKEILIATKNKGKIREFEELFSQFGFRVKSLLNLESVIDVVEDGLTFRENATKKAETIAKQYNIATLADDSGLIVDALNGEPGVFSARYAGPNKDDRANMEKVLHELIGVKDSERAARFHCSLALAIPGHSTILVDGTCEGKITHEPKGENGFGYDPIMYIPQKNKTMAELSKEEKNEISHRALALKKMKEVIQSVL